MREDMPKVDDLPSIFDDRDKPILVAGDVKHRENSDRIRMPKILARFRRIRPSGALRYQVPVQQRLQGVRVAFGELGDSGFTDDPQMIRLPKW
jgi:hypothetical protein